MDDSPSSTLSQNGEDVRDYQSEPSSGNTTLLEEEVLQSDDRPAFEETESPGLDFEFVHDVDAVQRNYQKLGFNGKHAWARQSKWFQMHLETAPKSDHFSVNGLGRFERRILRCRKP